MNKKYWLVVLIAACAVGFLFYLELEPDDSDRGRGGPPRQEEDVSDSARRGEPPRPQPPRQEGDVSDSARRGEPLRPQPPRQRSPRLNAWAAALGTNRLAAAERRLKLQKVEREMTEDEQKLAESAHDIASASDADAARKFAAEQLNAEHPKVREAAVFALANCGTPCLAELTPYMADADEGVRTEAVSAWQSAWFEMPESNLKAEAAVAVMCVLNDEMALEPIAAELMKFKRVTAEEALDVALEQGTEAGKTVARRIRDAFGINNE